MQIYDIIMLAVLAGATLFGAYKGLAWQIASLASMVLSYAVAFRFRDQLAPMVGEEAPWNVFLAMAILFAGTSLGIWIAFRFVKGFIDRVKLREFDRQLGAIFGFAKGAVICIAVTFFAVTLSSSAREAVLSSRSGYYIAHTIDKAHYVMPEELHEVIGPYLHQLEGELGDQISPHEKLGRPSEGAFATEPSNSGRPLDRVLDNINNNQVEQWFNQAQNVYDNTMQQGRNADQNIQQQFQNAEQQFNNLQQQGQGVGQDLQQRFQNAEQQFNNLQQQGQGISQDLQQRFRNVQDQFNNNGSRF